MSPMCRSQNTITEKEGIILPPAADKIQNICQCFRAVDRKRNFPFLRDILFLRITGVVADSFLQFLVMRPVITAKLWKKSDKLRHKRKEQTAAEVSEQPKYCRKECNFQLRFLGAAQTR